MALPGKIRRGVSRQAAHVLETGNRFKRFDQIRQRHFWSKYRFTPDANGFIASGEFDLFQTPVGQAGQGYTTQLSLLETNWPSANRVPDNQNFEITELGVSAQVQTAGLTVNGNEFNSNVYHLLENELLRNMIVAITYLTNTVPLGMCTDFAQSSGPHIGFYQPGSPVSEGAPPVVAIPDPRRTFVSNGAPGPGLRRKFKIPILLQHGETFRFSFLIPQGRGPYVQRVDQDDAAPSPNIDVRLDFWATESFVEKS
jgi:hypothetical protein